MNELSRKQRILILIIYFGGYLGLYQLLCMPLLYKHLSLMSFRVSQLFILIAFLFIYLLICGKWMKQEFEQFKKKLGQNTGIALVTVMMIELFVLFMSLLLVDKLHLTTAENQANNLAYEKVDPIGFGLDALVIAPFSEELVFRGCIFAPLRKKKNFWMGTLTAGCLFGFLHVLSSLLNKNWHNLLYFFLYSGCGILLAFPYEATNSICTSMLTHLLYNLLGVIGIIAR